MRTLKVFHRSGAYEKPNIGLTSKTESVVHCFEKYVTVTKCSFKTGWEWLDACTDVVVNALGPLKSEICCIPGWMMDDLRFYVLCNSISVISGRC